MQNFFCIISVLFTLFRTNVFNDIEIHHLIDKKQSKRIYNDR